MGWFSYLTYAIVIFNTLCVLGMVFVERKKPSSVISWSIIMLLFPIAGLIIYCLIGGSLSFKTRRMLKRKAIRSKELKELVKKQKAQIESDEVGSSGVEAKYKQLIMHNLNTCESMLTHNNKVKLFCNGPDKIDALLKDIDNAKKSINMCYYIFATDNVGMKVLKKLIEKANQGVEVNLLVDAVGSLKSDRREFKRLVQGGGRFAEFFPPIFGIRLFNIRVNYRNHRKIVVIDNKIGYVGGINIRDDHMGMVKRLSPWTDLHMRVEGDSVIDLQKTFLKDWRFSYKNKNKDFDDTYINRFFEKGPSEPGVAMQVVTSGPDDDGAQIEMNFINMITKAKKYILIQSPYFVPDESFMTALRIAINSGVKVSIMLSKVPDKKVVYYCSLSYLKELVDYGAVVYLREGFIHSKVVIVDGEIASTGTCNTDVRSFSLNFEVNMMIYDKVTSMQLVKIFENDVMHSIEVNKAWLKNLPKRIKVAKSLCRLFSAIL